MSLSLGGLALYAPTILEAFSALQGGRSTAKAYRQQARVVSQEATADEEAQRRETRLLLGTQAAAMAQAGGGIDEGVVRQSELMANLDALNIRYRGQLARAGLMSEAAAAKKQGAMLAGQKLLTGIADNYTGGFSIPGAVDSVRYGLSRYRKPSRSSLGAGTAAADSLLGPSSAGYA